MVQRTTPRPPPNFDRKLGDPHPASREIEKARPEAPGSRATYFNRITDSHNELSTELQIPHPGNNAIDDEHRPRHRRRRCSSALRTQILPHSCTQTTNDPAAHKHSPKEGGDYPIRRRHPPWESVCRPRLYPTIRLRQPHRPERKLSHRVVEQMDNADWTMSYRAVELDDKDQIRNT